MKKPALLLILSISTIVFTGCTHITPPSGDSAAPAQEDNSAVTPPVPTQVPFRPFSAQFFIFTQGTERVFTDTKYHRQSTDSYIAAENPSLVHVAKPNLTWADFFSTLPLSLTTDCLVTGTKQTFCTTDSQKLSFFLNGTEEPRALEKIIQPGDQLLVTVGPPGDTRIQRQLQRFD